jgi:cobaltochelatase CobT
VKVHQYLIKVARIEPLSAARTFHEIRELPAVSASEQLHKSELPQDPIYEIAEARLAGDAIGNLITMARPYYAYTKAFDEVIDAAELADNSELLGLYNYVSSLSADLKRLHSATLASKLGLYERVSAEPPLAVSILIDNSGSMRGTPILETAAWCLLIMEGMDRLGIPTEILGFTTRAWKGGQSREAWFAGGKPSRPGRLNDIRHLVYKSFSTTTEVAAPNFGVMALEGLLKENIDGEALLWASSRLQDQPAKKKILFVFSDGAPVDDSTLSVNPGTYLENHLKAVITELSKRISLHAIGIGHDVSRYYPNSIALTDRSLLGLRFFDALIDDPTFQEFWKRKFIEGQSWAS